MITIETILKALSEDVRDFRGDRGAPIAKPSSIARGSSGDITFCTKTGLDGVRLIESSACGAFIVPVDLPKELLSTRDLNLIFVDNPRLSFMRAVAICFSRPRPVGIHPSAVIHPEAEIDSSAFVGPLCHIGRCSIGPGSVLWGSLFVYDGVRIGANVTIHAGAVLGADGFGYERTDDGSMQKFPHLGGVLVENDVEIGANACIDRGTLDDTTIRRGAKIDNLVHIAHNVVVGEDAVVIAHAMIGGSTRIGPRAWIAPSACVRDQVAIGEDAVVGLASVVTKDVAKHSTVIGSPAREMHEHREMMRALKTIVEKPV